MCKKSKASKSVQLQGLRLIHPQAAGIGAGAKEHVVAVPCDGVMVRLVLVGCWFRIFKLDRAIHKELPVHGIDSIGTVERIQGYLSMFFKASFRATSGVAAPFVAISKAAFIELQNLPICGMFGITTPFSAFS